MGKKLSRRDFLYLTGGALGAAATGCGRREASSPGELPRYVDDDLRHGWPVPRGPYLQRDARIAAFWLPADGDALHRLCQRYLSAPTNGAWDYVPAMPYVAMLYAEMDVLSTDARDQALGHSRERELSFWAPVVGRRKAGGLWTPDHAAWFLPCLYVDNPSALVTGREVYGFPKMWGRFEPPTIIQNPEFAVDAWRFETETEEAPPGQDRMQRLAELKRRDPEDALVSAVTWGNWDVARAEIIRLLRQTDSSVDLETLRELVDLEGIEIPLVFLKQFRDAADTRRACYQAIIRTNARLDTFHQGGFLEHTYYLELPSHANHPLDKLLGLRTNQQGDVQALMGFWIHVDFVLAHGAEVWKAPT